MFPLYRTTSCLKRVFTSKPSYFLNINSSLYGLSANKTEYINYQKRNFYEDRKTTALAVLENVKQVRHSPVSALVFGLSGLIPFVASPCYMISNGMFMPEIADAQLKYGAIILSFIGGIRWGLTLPPTSTQSPDLHNLGYSITPSLIAWAGLLISPNLGTLTVMTGLGLTGYMDIFMWGYPTWFKGMRFCLTLVAVLSLWTSLVCKFMLDSSDKENTSNSKV